MCDVDYQVTAEVLLEARKALFMPEGADNVGYEEWITMRCFMEVRLPVL